MITMVSLFDSCSNITINQRSDIKKDIISEDSPWFNCEIINIDMDVDELRPIASISPIYSGADSNNIVVFLNGSYKVKNWDDISSNSDYAIKMISVIDRNAMTKKKSINLYNIIEQTDWPEQVIYYEGNLIVKCQSWKSESDTYYKKEYKIDIETERIVETYETELDRNLHFRGSYIVGKYRLEAYSNHGSVNEFYTLRIISPNTEVKEVEIKVSGKDVYEIPVILSCDNNTALIPVAIDREYLFYKLDLLTYKISLVNSNDYNWIDINKLISSYNGLNGYSFVTSPQGIIKIDLKNKSIEQVLDYSCCDVNRKYVNNLNVADISDNSILLCGSYHSSNMFTSIFVNDFVIIKLNKADCNPHVGKNILELYISGGDVDEITSDAIIRFNNTNSKYFIELSDRYDRSAYLDYSDINSLDDYDSMQLNANARLSNDLAMDLINGEGPDILLNTSNLGQLNNDNYLVDLTPYLTDLDTDKYFTNIIDGAKLDGKLYQLPISFTIEGIQTDPEYAGNTGIGFTTEEYNKFLYETLNGKDVIESGQSLYFVKLFNSMSDRFILNGKVFFTGSDFADIAGYVRDNVRQDSLSWDIITDENTEDINFTTQGNKIAYYCGCPGISGYLVKRAQIKNGTAILGIPSSDGRGPMFGADISVAVSKHAVNIDTCVEFVKMLISDDVQNELVMSDKFVLNRDAFKTGCNAAIEYFNTEEGSQNMFDYAAGTYVTSHMKFTSDDIDNLENIILSCSKMDSADSAINAILIEEMPAYFLGQKDLDSVVVVIQDRAQKVLDERG